MRLKNSYFLVIEDNGLLWKICNFIIPNLETHHNELNFKNHLNMIENGKKYLFLIGLMILSASGLLAQNTFQKSISTSYPFLFLADVTLTSDSGYVILARTLSGVNGISQTWLIRMDLSSQIISQIELGNSSGFSPASIIALNDGGFLICSSTIRNAQSLADLGLTKVDSDFNVIWSKTYGGYSYDFGSRVKQTNDGGFIACGLIGSQNGLLTYLVKTDSDGNLQWTRVFDDVLHNNWATDVEQTEDSGYIICGRILENPMSYTYDGYIIKTDSTGSMQWNKTYSSPEWNTFEDMTLSGDGGYFLFGVTDLVADSLVRRDFSLTKTDSLGDVLWSKVYERPKDDFGFSIINTSDNGLLLCGVKDYNTNNSSCIIIKTDTSGNILWNKSYNSFSNYSYGNRAIQTFDGGYFVGTTMNDGVPQLFLIKTDSSGNSYCTDSVPAFTISNTSYTTSSPFISSVNDSNSIASITTNPLTYSDINLCFTGIPNIENALKSFKIYPNPVNSALTIEIDNAKSIKIYDLPGKVIMDKKIADKVAGKIELDVTPLANGLYFINIDNAVQIFVKE